MTTLSTKTERTDLVPEIHVRDEILFVTFSASSDCIVGALSEGLRVWQVEDGEEVARLEAAYHVSSLGVSKDGSWIAAGGHNGRITVWDAKTYRREDVWDTETYEREHIPGPFAARSTVLGVDFSPNSTRIVSTQCHAAIVWDLTAIQKTRVLTLRPAGSFSAVKYSTKGDRIATATDSHVQVWDSNNGHLLASTVLEVTPLPYNGPMLHNGRLAWLDNCLFVICGNTIKKIEASTISESPVPDGQIYSSIAVSMRGELLFVSNHAVTFWDMSTRTCTRRVPIQQAVDLIALSPNDQLLATSLEGGEITLERLSCITEPLLIIDDASLNSWMHDQLARAESLLSTAISTSRDSQALASRALVRTRLRQWEAAMDDAEESIKLQPSLLGYIAKSFVLAGKGEKQQAYRACDMAFEHCHPAHVSFLLLTKAVIVFLAGEHDDAISRVGDLIEKQDVKFSICHVVQAYMHLLHGNSCMESHDYKGATQSFKCAQAQLKMSHRTIAQTATVLSLMSGWKFSSLVITIQQQLCEALYAAGHLKEASWVVLEMVRTSDDKFFMGEGIAKWVSNFTQQYLNAPQCDNDTSYGAVSDDEVAVVHPTFNQSLPSSLLRTWATASILCKPWQDALHTIVNPIIPRFTIYRAICECLEMQGHILDATKCFIQMANELAAEIPLQDEQAKWAAAFQLCCAKKLEDLGNVAVGAQQYDDAIVQYSAVLSLNILNPYIFVKRSKAYLAKGLWENALHDVNYAIALPSSSWGYWEVLVEWTNMNLINGLWKGVLAATCGFDIPRFTVCQKLCECLEMKGTMDAVECFHQMTSMLTVEALAQDELEWICNFRHHCCKKLEQLGDAAMDSQQHNKAFRYFSAVISISPAAQDLPILQSKVCTAKRSWGNALDHANEAITLDPISPLGYEAKHAALHGAGSYDDAIQTFEMMLSKMDQSPDPQVRERRSQYIDPSDTRVTIRKIVQRTIRHSPRVLINTTTGRLRSKTEQEDVFMSLPIVNELVSSMTTQIDHRRIKREVRQFFRYVMLSHRWEKDEPLFHQVIQTAVYDLDESPTHNKLKMFCKLVGDAGFEWAWSDTCCINKEDHFILQEALVAMFKWYRGSAMVFVFLQDVLSPGRLGDLMRSLWNTRAWTLQEYVAAKVIRFYTQDWTPYLNLNAFNHKDSPEIVSEMEKATEVSAQQLMTLRPGMSSIREKLRLASTRQTTFVEDAAYSLLGIFSVSGIPAIYGEGESALGRLLSHILAVSGDTSILAWTGQSGGHNSCLPAHITAFNRAATSHLPLPIEDSEMKKKIIGLHNTGVDVELAMELYDRLSDLPAPWFAASRMKLPCIAFKLPSLSPSRAGSSRIYRVETPVLGLVEIKTRQDPSRLGSLYLVHPWLDALLDREETHTGTFIEDEDGEDSEPSLSDTDDDGSVSDEDGDAEEEDTPSLHGRTSPSPPPAHVHAAPMDRETRALRLIAHLRQPFGALLLSVRSTRRRAVVYKRVAADSEITVQLRESVPLNDILDNVRILDVL